MGMVWASRFSFIPAVVVACLVACGSDTAPGSNLPSSSASSTSASSSSGGVTFKSCTDAELDADVGHLDTGADITATSTVAQYTQHCVRIRVGKTVGFYAPFDVHPLANNGEANNPIPKVLTGMDSGRIAFPTAGTYGFHCAEHPSVMYGAVKVVP